MTTNDYATMMSTALADAVERAAPAVVQVQGRRRPASGLVYAREVVLTMTRALGREDGLHVRDHSGQVFDAQLAGWDPATSLAVLRVPGLSATPIPVGQTAPRVGNLAIAIARSWSNSVTASAGIVSVIAGPLPTGRRRAIEQVLRTTAPMHEGFAGGAFIDTSGALVGVTTAAEIRGLGVVIPASIALPTAASHPRARPHETRISRHRGSDRAATGSAGGSGGTQGGAARDWRDRGQPGGRRRCARRGRALRA